MAQGGSQAGKPRTQTESLSISTAKVDGPIRWYFKNKWTDPLLPRNSMDRFVGTAEYLDRSIGTFKMNGPVRETLH